MELKSLLKKTELPQIALPSPVLSLADAGAGGVWVGGIGGVAHFARATGWTPYISGLATSGISALATSDNWLFAGGVEGVSRSKTDSIAWELARIEGKAESIAALAISPEFADDKSALAATLSNGILRSEDGGVIWRSANFGLQNFEVTCLLWNASDVLAGTMNGLYRSPNGGRAWRLVDETLGTAFAAMITLPDGHILAATDDGLLIKSDDNGASWAIWKNNLPDDLAITALSSIGRNSLLLGTGGSGLWLSVDAGRKWKQVSEVPIFCIQATEKYLYVGTAIGLMGSSDNGKTWEHLPLSPLHDLRRIDIANGNLIVSGGFSVTLRYAENQWQAIPNVPIPLTLLTQNQNGRLFAAGVEGLFISDDSQQWRQVLGSTQGHLRHMTFRDAEQGWAISADSARILRTTDGGSTWQIAASPLGTDTIVALASSADLVFAATYNPLQQTARLWFSKDDGNKWQRGAEARTNWSIVGTYHQPPMVSLGGTILAQQADDDWQAATMPKNINFAIRRILGRAGQIFVLTTNGFLVSDDNAKSFDWLEGVDLPADQIMDFALDAAHIYVLSVGGKVTVFEIES